MCAVRTSGKTRGRSFPCRRDGSEQRCAASSSCAWLLHTCCENELPVGKLPELLCSYVYQRGALGKVVSTAGSPGWLFSSVQGLHKARDVFEGELVRHSSVVDINVSSGI